MIGMPGVHPVAGESDASDAAGAPGAEGAAVPDGHGASSPVAARERPRWWAEALVMVGLLWFYDTVNNLAALRRQAAFDHAFEILRLERWLRLDPERALNAWAGAHRLAGVVFGDYYDLLHFVITIGLVIWLWWRHPDIYRPLRNILVAINVIGFIVFWLYPLAPPRMLATAGFVDVVAVSHAVGSWTSGALASQANEFAAMPSLHMAWAVWCSLAVWRSTRALAGRLLALAYPVLTAVVVMATANHFLLDVIAGLITTAAAAVAAALAARAWQSRTRLTARLASR